MNKTVSRIISVVLVVGLMAISATFLIIYRDVKKVCIKARSQYKENCPNSLIKTIQSENVTSREKNSAIWALGQLADKNSLEFLYELNKSLPDQKRCDYNKHLCKYGVEKAIQWCEKGNITNWMYKAL